MDEDFLKIIWHEYCAIDGQWSNLLEDEVGEGSPGMHPN